MYETLDSILELTEEERNKRYLENLKSKIESDENKDELQKRLSLLMKELYLFILIRQRRNMKKLLLKLEKMAIIIILFVRMKRFLEY